MPSCRNLTILLLLATAAASSAQEPPPDAEVPPGGRDVYLSVREGVEQIAVALPTPRAEADVEGAARDLAEVTRNDLHFSGLFQIVDPSWYRWVEEETEENEPPRVTAKRWRSIGAAYLLRSRLAGGDDEIVLEAWLVDLESGDEVLGKRYRTRPDLARRMAHHLADDILTYFTGSRSVFTTHVAYVSRRGEAQEIYLADYDGANERQLTRTGTLNLSPAVSPSGKLLAFTSYLSGQPRLHLADIETGEIRSLFDCTGLCQSASWSPRGDQLAFSMSVDGNPEIYVVSRDGLEPVRLTDHPAIEVSPVWSPTGDELAFVSDRSGGPQLYAMDRYGLNVRRLTYAFEQATDPAWSPKGDRIAYTGRVEGSHRICLLDLAALEETCFPPTGSGDEAPAWSPDGEYLAFLAATAGRTTMHMRRADGTGEARPVFLRGDPKTPDWYR